MSLGLYISGPPPPMHHIAAQPQDEFAGVGLAGTGLGAQPAVQTPPEFLGLLEDFFRRPHLHIADHFPGKVFESIIPRSVRLAEAPSFGKSIFDFDVFSKGARAYKNLAQEILRMEKEGEGKFHL